MCKLFSYYFLWSTSLVFEKKKTYIYLVLRDFFPQWIIDQGMVKEHSPIVKYFKAFEQLIGYLNTGSPLFIQERVGKDKKPFKLIKFRTMNVNTESVASHLANNQSITKLGKFLRKTKIDELPQLLNVLKGEMSLVGPRPNLSNQVDLIKARADQGVYDVLPGITGLAQLSGVDMSTPERLAKKDKEMIDNITLKDYFSYIIRIALGKGSGDAVK